jgi:hypothetical protein
MEAKGWKSIFEEKSLKKIEGLNDEDIIECIEKSQLHTIQYAKVKNNIAELFDFK